MPSASTREPFLPHGDSRDSVRRRSSGSSGGRRPSTTSGQEGVCGAFGSLCSLCCGLGNCLCLRALIVLACVLVAFWIGITRNLYCNPEALANVEVPYGGQIIPGNVSLRERKWFFQFTRLVDVYDHDGEQVGYFYDINLLIIMRFGYSDTKGRIWFEARYASFLSRFKPIVEYYVQRCDTGVGGRTQDLFLLKEDWLRESWFCVYHCIRLFNLSMHETDKHVHEQLLLPEAKFADDAVARVQFDSTLTPAVRGKMTETVDNHGLGVVSFRHRWSMLVWNWTSGETLATARQRFTIGGLYSNLNVLSRWNLTGVEEESSIPNWVVAYLSVLDDIEEDFVAR